MEKYINFFNDYTDKFDTNMNAIALKKEHTYRVVNKCALLAKSLNLNNEDLELSMIIGLFHDIGRFYQYTEYGSFFDYKTIDHGDLGVEIVNNQKILEDNPNKEIIIKAIRNHNKYEIENNLSEREKLFCKVIRDADKLDILELVIEGKIKVSNHNEEYNENAINDIINGKQLLISKYPNDVDKTLVRFGLINDINFDYSKQYILNNHILDQLIDIFEKANPIGKEDINKIKVKLNERLGK